MSEDIAVLRGGPHDGESSRVDRSTRRLFSRSEAPGLVEVYEANGQSESLPGNDQPASVFVHIGQQNAEGINPDTLHSP